MGERDEEGVTRPGETPISRARAKSSSKPLILGLLAKEGAVLEFSAGAIGISLPESWGVGDAVANARSNASIYRLHTIGETGDPIAAPCICW